MTVQSLTKCQSHHIICGPRDDSDDDISKMIACTSKDIRDDSEISHVFDDFVIIDETSKSSDIDILSRIDVYIDIQGVIKEIRYISKISDVLGVYAIVDELSKSSESDQGPRNLMIA